MTIICVKNSVMAADSGVWTRSVVQRSVTPKIYRTKTGCLLAGSGACEDITMLWKWADDKFLQKHKPDFVSGFSFLMLKPNSELIFGNAKGPLHAREQPCACGSVADFAYAAMLAGLSAEDAVDLCIKWTSGARGPIQVEKL